MLLAGWSGHTNFNQWNRSRNEACKVAYVVELENGNVDYGTSSVLTARHVISGSSLSTNGLGGGGNRSQEYPSNNVGQECSSTLLQLGVSA